MTKICAPSLSMSRETYAKKLISEQEKTIFLTLSLLLVFPPWFMNPFMCPIVVTSIITRYLVWPLAGPGVCLEMSVLNFWVSCTGEMEKGESNDTQLFHKRNLLNYLIHRLLRWITELPAEKEMYFLGSLSNASIHLKSSVTAILRKVCVCISATNCTAALLSKLLKCVTKVVLQQHSSPGVKAPGYWWCRQLCL